MRRSSLVPTVILLSLPVLLLWRQTWGGAMFGADDGLDCLYPILALFQSALRDGELPLWNPYVFSGQTYAAHYNAPIYYPPNYLVALMAPDRYMVWTVALHMGLGGVGMWRLLRRWDVETPVALFGGAAYVLSTPFIAETDRFMIAQVLGWFPWLVIACERAFDNRRWIGAAGIVAGLQLLCGHSQHVQLEMLVLVTLLVARWGPRWGWLHATACLTGIGALGVAIGAVAWLPLMHAMPLFTRSLVPEPYFWVYGVQPHQLARLITPEIANPEPFYGYTVPLPLFLLAVLGAVGTGPRHGRLRLASLLALGLGLLLAFGSETALSPWLSAIIPLYGKLRYRGRYTLLAVLGIIWLACVGLDRLMREPRRDWVRPTAVTVMLVVLVESFVNGVAATEVCDTRLSLATPSLSLMPRDPGFHRFMTAAYLNRKYWAWGMVVRKRAIGGFGTCSYTRYERFLHYASEKRPLDADSLLALTNRNHLRERIDLKSPLVNLLGLKYVIWSEAPRRAFHVLTASGVLPHGFVCSDWKVVPDLDTGLTLLASPEFDPLRTAVVEDALPASPQAPAGPSTCEVTEQGLNALSATVDVAGPGSGILVLGEIFDPGWSATVDGADARVFPVDVVLRGVQVPPGVHRVDLRYVPPGLYPGLAITTLGVLAALAMLSLGRPRMHARPTPEV